MYYYTKLTPTNKRPPLVYYCTLYTAHKINGSDTTISISIKSRFANYFIIENKIEILVKSYQIETLDTFGKWTFLIEVLVFTIMYIK